MKKLLSLFALVLMVCSTAMAETLTAESEVGTVGILAGREAMVVDLGGSIGKVAIAMKNVGAVGFEDYGTRFTATDALDPEKNELTDGWYIPSREETEALNSYLQWESNHSAVYYNDNNYLQLPLYRSGESHYGYYITSTTSVSESYTNYAYLRIEYLVNAIGDISSCKEIREEHDKSNLAIRPFHKMLTKNQCLFYTSSDGNVVTPNDDAFNVNILSNTYENGQGIIIFSGELTSIGDYAFSGKSTLTSVALPASLRSIGEDAFKKTSISSVVIPASVTSIGNYAFNGCSNLKVLAFAEGSQLETIGDNAFLSTGITGELTLPASLKSIGDWVFNATKLTAVTIPASMTSIGNNAFNGCSSLATLTFAEDSQLETIGDYAFYQTGITGELTLPASLKVIGSYAFNSTAISGELTLPASVTTIGNGAFSGCSQLSSLTFAEGTQLETIGVDAFNSTGIKGELTIPATVTSIGDAAFGGCQLTNVYMSFEISSGISNRAFNDGVIIFVPAELYEAYNRHFNRFYKVEVKPLSDWQEYTIVQIDAAMKTANTISPTDKTTIANYISTIENATTFDGTLEAYYAALALIDKQKAFEEKVKGVFNTLGTKQDGPAIEIVGKDGQTIKLYNIEKVNFGKVKTEE